MLLKKSIITASVALAVLTATTASFAAGTGAGFVVGGGLGWAKTNWSNLNDNGVSDDANGAFRDTGFAARAFAGYDFNKYLGVEAGYTYLPSATIRGTHSSDFRIRNYALDLLGKLSVPVGSAPVSLYAKAGVGYLNSRIEHFGSTQTNRHFGPAFGAGVAYEVIPNLAVDLSWMRYSGDNRLNHQNASGNSTFQPSPDVILVGVSYKFPVNYS